MRRAHSFAVQTTLAGILVAPLLLLACSCGRSQGPAVDVRGKVTLDGKPFSQGCVWFSSPKSGAGFRANLAADGTYSVRILDVRLGETYGVFIGGIEPEVPADPKKLGNPPGIAVPPVPAKYCESATSGLKATIEKAKRHTFDFELRSK